MSAQHSLSSMPSKNTDPGLNVLAANGFNMHQHDKNLRHIRLLDAWQQTIKTAKQAGPRDPLWQRLRSSIQYLDLDVKRLPFVGIHRDFSAPDSPYCEGLRKIESLDLNNKNMSLYGVAIGVQYLYSNPTTVYNLFKRSYISRRQSRNLELIYGRFPAYRSTFVYEHLEARVNVASLSSASRYHMESLLRYKELEGLNIGLVGRFCKINLHYVDKKSYSFANYLKLPIELRAIISRMSHDPQPRRLQLKIGPQQRGGQFIIQTGIQTLACFTTLEPRPIPPILQVHKELRARTTVFHDYVELKLHTSDARGLIYLPKVDMLFICHETASSLTPEAFKASLVAVDSLQNVKSIALSAHHPHFRSFVQDFKNYLGLELVFIVVDYSRNLYDWPARRLWGLEDIKYKFVDSRLSSRFEVLFEELNPGDIWVDNYVVPLGDDYFPYWRTSKDPRTMDQLMLTMARGGGLVKVAPNVRFVRLVKRGATKAEEKKEDNSPGRGGKT